MTPKERAAATTGAVAAAPALVLGLIVGVVAGLVAGVVAFVAVAAAVACWAWFAGDRRALSVLGGREADPVTDARLINLVEGLSVGAGVPQPRLRVVESDGLNALAVGIRADRAVIGVTSGLLRELNRMELEAVLAEEVAQIRRGETVPASVAVATFGIARGIALGANRDPQADLAAVGITRYPPALVSALEKVDTKGASVPGQPAYMAHLWLADPAPTQSRQRREIPLHDRIEALREL